MSDQTALELFRSTHEARVQIEMFLDWCEEEGIELAGFREDSGRLMPLVDSHASLLMRYFGIDPQQLEVERRALLDQQPGRVR